MVWVKIQCEKGRPRGSRTGAGSELLKARDDGSVTSPDLTQLIIRDGFVYPAV